MIRQHKCACDLRLRFLYILKIRLYCHNIRIYHCPNICHFMKGNGLVQYYFAWAAQRYHRDVIVFVAF